ncbi:lysine--tRNA ligase [[Eubacterium] cellulosolvens]
MKEKIIGRGTWLDKVADKVIKRSYKLGKASATIRTESGIGASGIPHIGSFADAARAYGVKLAVEDRGYASEYIAFSDDKDGLRKVPDGFPQWLSKYIAFPVSSIPDPFRCHESYGAHMSSLLLDALDQIGIEYTFISASKAYQQGIFKDEITRILDASEKIGEIIQQEISQEKYLETLPYFPICQNCGRIYTTRAYKWHRSEEKIQYRCETIGLRDQTIPGCGYEGEIDYRSGEGKLSWKVEFAVRWSALDIDFEAYGKDIADSVRVNDVIMKQVLHKEPPHHVQYEMFLDKSGRKISKSLGNVFTPQIWLRYGGPGSLMLLMYKRIVGTRELSIEDIPKYMDEFDKLEDIYFEKKKIEDEMELAKLKGLYEYCTLLKPPNSAHAHIPYSTLLELVKVAPPGKEKKFIAEKLNQYGISHQKDPEDVNKRIRYALNWIADFQEERKMDVTFNNVEKEALEELIKKLKEAPDETAIQNLLFSIAKSHNIAIKKFFQIIYMILLNKPSGPKLGSYILSMGKDTVIEKLQLSLN